MTTRSSSPARRGDRADTVPREAIFGHPDRPLRPLLHRDVGALLLLRHARAARALRRASASSHADVAPTVPGFDAVRAALERVFGQLDDEQLADQIYGLYTAVRVPHAVLRRHPGRPACSASASRVVIGGIIMAIGEFMLMKESLFFPALIMLVIGNGFFKSNISTQVGGLYTQGDPAPRPRVQHLLRRHQPGRVALARSSAARSARARSPPATSAGPGASARAGVGMLVGLVIYLWGQQYLAPDQIMEKAAATGAGREEAVHEERVGAHHRARRPLRAQHLVLGRLRAAGQLAAVLGRQQGEPARAPLARAATGRCRRRGSSRSTRRSSSSCTLVINPLWAWLAKKGKDPSSVAKMAIGCFLLGISFLVMIPAPAASSTAGTRRASAGSSAARSCSRSARSTSRRSASRSSPRSRRRASCR